MASFSMQLSFLLAFLYCTASPPPAAPPDSLHASRRIVYEQKPDLSFLPKNGTNYCIYVDMTAYRAYLLEQKTDSATGAISISCLDTSLVACGKPGTLTPLNTTVKQNQITLFPSWTPTHLMVEIAARKNKVKKYQRPDTPEHPNPGNPAGRVKMVVVNSPRPFRIHGTNEPGKITADGANISSGCIRFLRLENFTALILGRIPHTPEKPAHRETVVKLSQPIYIHLHYNPVRSISIVDSADAAYVEFRKDKDAYRRARVVADTLLTGISKSCQFDSREKFALWRKAAADSLAKHPGEQRIVRVPLPKHMLSRNLSGI